MISKRPSPKSALASLPVSTLKLISRIFEEPGVITISRPSGVSTRFTSWQTCSKSLTNSSELTATTQSKNSSSNGSDSAPELCSEAFTPFFDRQAVTAGAQS